jgi:hypothetical protein
MDDFSKYKEIYKKLKIIRGDDQEKIMKQLEEFEKAHNVIDVKQGNDKMMFVFYLE